MHNVYPPESFLRHRKLRRGLFVRIFGIGDKCTQTNGVASESNIEEDCKGIDGAALAFWILVAWMLCAGAALLYFSWWRPRQKEKNSTDSSKPATKSRGTKFEKLIDATREEFASLDETHTIEKPPRNGTYVHSFDTPVNSQSIRGTTELRFAALPDRDDGSPTTKSHLTIQGSTTDELGVADIDEGYCNADGRAWWVATYITDEDDMRVLCKGQFERASDGTVDFSGKVYTSRGIKGKFDYFTLQTEES